MGGGASKTASGPPFNKSSTAEAVAEHFKERIAGKVFIVTVCRALPRIRAVASLARVLP